MAPATPVIIGVADVKNRSVQVEDALEPAQLMLEAIRQAIQDTGLDSASQQQLQSQIDSIDVVRTWTWPYRDLPGLLAEKLRIQPEHRFCTDHGGNQPAKLLDEAARRIALGKTKVAVITGGEALASRESLQLLSSSDESRANTACAVHVLTDCNSGRLRESQQAASPWLDSARQARRVGLFSLDPGSG